MSKISVNGVELWYRVTGEGDPVIQIHGSGFGHFNFDPVTPILSESFKVVDYDMRGYGESDRPVQHYDMEVWADDVAGLMRALDIEAAHIHGSSMGGMIAVVFAGKYPELARSVIINCAAAKLGAVGRLMNQNYIDIVRMDPDGVASKLLAHTQVWHALSGEYLASPEGADAPENINRILSASNRPEVFIAACEAMMDMDLRPWLGKITAPALVIGGAKDIMTPWDQGPGGAGQNEIYEGIANAEKSVLENSAHSSIFDDTDEYVARVLGFLRKHSAHPVAA